MALITPIVAGLQIIGVRNAGNLIKERLLLKATEPIRPEHYIVVNVKQNTASSISILNDKVYWFSSDILVNTGEYIRLYTKSGVYKRVETTYGESPAVFHNFYWGLDSPVWSAEKTDAVTVLKVNSWDTKTIS